MTCVYLLPVFLYKSYIASRSNRGVDVKIAKRLMIGRLCIAAADRGRLLDDSKWPEYVTISEWYRGKPAATAQTADEPTVTTEHTAHGAMGESPSVNDNTIVYSAGADTANMEESGQLASVGHGD